jgi:hypothetical protein
MYRGWDVHSYTPDIRSVTDIDFRNLEPVNTRIEMDALFRDIASSVRDSRACSIFLNKLRRRVDLNTMTYTDPQTGIEILSLLKKLWVKVRECNDDSVFELFETTIRDAGTTCIQGDSHRLVSMYIALERDGKVCVL